jgi:hypothetical protein
MPSLNTGNAILSNPIKVDSSYNVGIGGAASGSFKLQVTGTTNLTGALTGTSATFSGALQVGGTGSSTITIGDAIGSAADSNLRLRTGSTKYAWLIASQNNVAGFEITPSTAVGGTTFSTPALSILPTGAAAFSSSVTANSTINGYLGTITAGQNPATSGTTPTNPMLNLTNNRGIGMYFGGSYAGNYAQWIQVSDTGNLGVNYPLLLNPNGGNIGIGTTNTIYSALNIKSSGIYLYNGIAVYSTNGTESFLGIGNSGTECGLFATYGASGSYLPITFSTGGTERMRITSGGYTKMTNGGSYLGGNYHEFVQSTGNNYITTFKNDNANPYGIYINYSSATPNSGTNNEFIYCLDSTNLKFVVWSNGTVSNRTGTYGTISSDIRLKENIVEANSKLDDILKLRVVNFNLKEDIDKKKQIGFIAQEFQEVFPSLVYEKDTREYDEDGNVIKGLEDALGLNVGMEFAILVKAIQELKAEIEAQQQQINSLINR